MAIRAPSPSHFIFARAHALPPPYATATVRCRCSVCACVQWRLRVMMGFVGDASGMETYYESVWRREWEMTSAGAEKQMIMMPSGEAKWCCVSLREKNLARLAPNATPTALVGSGE